MFRGETVFELCKAASSRPAAQEISHLVGLSALECQFDLEKGSFLHKPLQERHANAMTKFTEDNQRSWCTLISDKRLFRRARGRV